MDGALAVEADEPSQAAEVCAISVCDHIHGFHHKPSHRCTPKDELEL